MSLTTLFLANLPSPPAGSPSVQVDIEITFDLGDVRFPKAYSQGTETFPKTLSLSEERFPKTHSQGTERLA